MSEDRIRVLFVDDDARLLEGLRRNLNEAVEVFTASNAIEGLRSLDRDGPFPVVVTDQNMPKVDGIAFLDKVAQHFPLTVQVMLSGNPDQGMLVRAVNGTGLYRFLSKPCGAADLVTAIRDAARRHDCLVAEKRVLKETVSGIVSLLTDMLASTHPTAFRRSRLVEGWARAAIRILDLQASWELETAARLWPLSYTALPGELAKRRDAGQPMSARDNERIASAYMSVAKLLGNVPRFAGVAKLLLMSCDGAAASSEPRGLEPEILRILINLSFRVDPACPDNADKEAAAMLAAATDNPNPALVSALPEILKAGEGTGSISALAAFELVAGDMLLSDLRDDDDRLLLASGETVSKAMTVRIRELHARGKISARVRVVRTTSKAA